MRKDQKQADSTTEYKKTMASKWERLMEPIRDRVAGKPKRREPKPQREFFLLRASGSGEGGDCV